MHGNSFSPQFIKNVLYWNYHSHHDLFHYWHLAPHRYQDGVLLGHTSLDYLSAYWYQLLCGSTFHQKRLSLIVPRCVWRFRSLGDWRTVLTEKTRGKGVVSDEPETQAT